MFFAENLNSKLDVVEILCGLTLEPETTKNILLTSKWEVPIKYLAYKWVQFFIFIKY